MTNEYFFSVIGKVTCLAFVGIQVASAAEIADGAEVRHAPGAMTELMFTTDTSVIEAIVGATNAVAAAKGKPDTRITNFVRAYGWGPLLQGTRIVDDFVVVITPDETPKEAADRAMAVLAERIAETTSRRKAFLAGFTDVDTSAHRGDRVVHA